MLQSLSNTTRSVTTLTKTLARKYPTSSLRSKKTDSRKLFSTSNSKVPPKWPAVVSAMIVPGMFLAWSVSDSIFGNRQIGKNETLRKEFLSQPTDFENQPVICFCVVRRTSGITHGLSGVQIGDVVEVLQEGVGPDNLYNLCRLPADPTHELSEDIYGWFPTRWLQKLDAYDKMVQEQLGNLEKKE